LGAEGFGFWAAAVMAAVLIGLSKGGLPVVGLMGVPVLTLFISPVMAAGLLLPVYVVSDMFGLWAYRRDFDARILRICVPAAVVGIGVGWATASVVPERLVTGLVGLIGAAFAVNTLVRSEPSGPPRTPDRLRGWFWGGVAGFTSFVSHAGAPPWQVYVLPLRLSKASFAGTSTVMFAIVNAVKLIPYYALGQLNPANLKIAAFLVVPASLAVLAGVWLVRVIPRELFFRLIAWALLLVSLKLLWDAAPG
jgi:uncharacterized membrane protein YfcA